MTKNLELFEEWGFEEDVWSSVMDKSKCLEFPPWVTWYWRTFEDASEDFLLARRCNVTSPIDFPFENMSVEHWLDLEFLGWTILVGILLALARSLLTNLIFLPLAKRFVTNKAKIDSFCESMIKVVYYSCAWSYCLYVLWDEPFFWDKTRLMDHNRMHNLYDFPTEFFILYYLQMGWYLQCLVTHFTHDTEKEDGAVMLTHHFVTLALIYCSFKCGYIEYGVLVLFSMDLCDVFLEVLRALRRILTLPDWAETALFIPLPVSWFLLRIYFYSDTILRHTIFLVPVSATGWQECYKYTHFNFLLIALFLMNLYWFFLILRIVFNKVILGVVLDDTREKDEKKDKKHKKKH